MEGLIIVFLAAVAMVVLGKKNGPQKNQTTSQAVAKAAAGTQANRQTSSVNQGPAAAIVKSPHYAKYKWIFDKALNEKQPMYKIEWLLESLNNGKELESNGYYVSKSMEKGLPYFCETEEEFDKLLSDSEPVLKDEILSLFKTIFYYGSESLNSHRSKRKYWNQRILELAISGNLEAQGALCSKRARLAFSEEEIEQFQSKYENTLRELATAGDPYAQLAVGEHLSPHLGQEHFDLLKKAANQGLGDAWYYLGKAYDSSMVKFDDKMNIIQVPKDEVERLKQARDECYFRAANSDNGVMVGYCQYLTGSMYEDGDSIFPKDYEKAKYWYKKASENGIGRGESRLNMIIEHPEWF